MTDGQMLFAVFAAFYALECMWLVHARAWIVMGGEHSKWRFRKPFDRWQIAGGAPALLSWLPPFRVHLQTLPWLFVPRDDKLAVRQPDGTESLLAWDTLEPRVEDQMLWLDGNMRVRMPSATIARQFGDLLKDWKALPAEKRRAAFLKHASQSLASTEAGKLADSAAKQTRATRIVGELTFVWTFGVITVIYRWFGESIQAMVVFAMVPLFTITQAWLFIRAVRKFPLEVPHCHWKALSMIFLPHQAARAADHLALSRVQVLHPLAFHDRVGREDFLAMARTFWRETRYTPGWKLTNTLPADAEALQAFFRHEKVAPLDYDPVPLLGKDAAAWCPRCHAPFLKADTVCGDCGGVELRTNSEL